MTGWLIMVLLTLGVVAGLFSFVRRDKGAFQFLLAALLLALAGYSWQGRPAQPGSPKSAEAPKAVAPDDFAVLHADLLGRFDRAFSWMTLADGDRENGNPNGAAQILQSAVRGNPRSYSLWIAFGYSLVAAGDGVMSPAARLAFSNAARLAPNHPGPDFFYALALTYPREIRTQADLDNQLAGLAEAEQIWQQQLQSLGTGYPLYRTAIAERLAAIREARAAGTRIRPAARLPQPAAAGQGAPSGAPPVAPAPESNSTD